MNKNQILGIGLVVASLLGYWLFGLWTRPPAVEHDNLRYIQLLRTAVSAKNEKWLVGVETALGQRRDEKSLSPSADRHFAKIVSLAKSGDWETADKMCFEFEKAQLNRRRKTIARDAHRHDHEHHRDQPIQAVATH